MSWRTCERAILWVFNELMQALSRVYIDYFYKMDEQDILPVSYIFNLL